MVQCTNSTSRVFRNFRNVAANVSDLLPKCCLYLIVHVNLSRKPKNARSKRELAKREPLAHENSKRCLFLKYTRSSSLLNGLCSNLHSLKSPYAVKFIKKNTIHPFDDPSSLEFFSEKNDASFLLFASHSKKRPHCMTWIRCFGGKVLDMLELLVVQDTARTLGQFQGRKCDVGIKPLLSFSGIQFESPTPNAYTLAKSMFVDFFRGAETQKIDVSGLQLLISFFVGEDGPDGEPAQIRMRCWKIVTKKSGQKVPRVEVEEIGPRIDFRVGRIKEADAAMRKEAMKRAKGSEVRALNPAPCIVLSFSFAHSLLDLQLTVPHSQAKPKKNVETDIVGDKVGRIHLGKQDLDQLQTRKMKGLKRSRADQEAGEGDEEIHNNDDDDEDDDGANDDAEDDDTMSVNSGTGGDESRESVEDDDDDESGVPLNKKARLDDGN